MINTLKKNYQKDGMILKNLKLQRDCYSASFLIMNVKNNLKEINRELCFKEFDNFKILHDKEI